MLQLKPVRTLEIGFAYGGSCLVFAASHRDIGNEPDHQHMALDPFQHQVWDDVGLLAMEKAGLRKFLDFQPTFSSFELPSLVAKQARFGLIYVDGSHLFEDVFVDAYFGIRLLEVGGVILFDDCSDPHVRKVIRFLQRGASAGTWVEMDLSPYRADSGRSMRYRLGGILGRRQLRAFKRLGDVIRPWNAPFRNF